MCSRTRSLLAKSTDSSRPAITQRATNSRDSMKPSSPSETSRTTWTATTPTRRWQRKRLAREFRDFLSRDGYQFVSDWPLSLLGTCSLHALRSGARVVAAVWFEPYDATRVALHLHASQDFRGRWVTLKTLGYLHDAARATKARHVLANPLPHHIPLVLRLGFISIGDGWYSLDLHE